MSTESHFTQYLDAGEPCTLSDAVTGAAVKNIGLPLMSFESLDALINGQSHVGGYVSSYHEKSFVELQQHGLIGARRGLTRRGAALAHRLQCLYFDGHDECPGCRKAARFLEQV